MDIAFRVRNVEVPDDLRRVTRDKVTRLGVLCGIDRAEVRFSGERNPRITEREVCRITLFGTSGVLRADAAATDVAVAADRVMGKLERRALRLRSRHRTRLRGQVRGQVRDRLLGGDGARVVPRWWAGPTGAVWFLDGSVHFPGNWSPAAIDAGAVDHRNGDAHGEAAVGFTDTEARPVTPEEAALEMARRGSDIFFFDNAETARSAVVYRRHDGEIALLDNPAMTDAAESLATAWAVGS